MNRFARALAVALAALLCTAPTIQAAEGGPSPNTPVPAGAGGTSAPTTVTAATTTPAVTATSQSYTVTVPSAPSTASGTQAPGQRPGAHPAKASSGTSTTAIVLAAIGALLVLACGAWAIVRARGVEPRWTLALRHAMAEAAHRTSATASELGDWMRLGR